METGSGSVSLGSNPSPAAPSKARYWVVLLSTTPTSFLRPSAPTNKFYAGLIPAASGWCIQEFFAWAPLEDRAGEVEESLFAAGGSVRVGVLMGKATVSTDDAPRSRW